MSEHEPVTINGETFQPTVVPCPSCEADIDAQRALIDGACPECHTDARVLCADEKPTEPPEGEHDAHKVSA